MCETICYVGINRLFSDNELDLLCAFFFEHNFETAYFKMVGLSMLTIITQLTIKRVFPQIHLNILQTTLLPTFI